MLGGVSDDPYTFSSKVLLLSRSNSQRICLVRHALPDTLGAHTLPVLDDGNGGGGDGHS